MNALGGKENLRFDGSVKVPHSKRQDTYATVDSRKKLPYFASLHTSPPPMHASGSQSLTRSDSPVKEMQQISPRSSVGRALPW